LTEEVGKYKRTKRGAEEDGSFQLHEVRL